MRNTTAKTLFCTGTFSALPYNDSCGYAVKTAIKALIINLHRG